MSPTFTDCEQFSRNSIQRFERKQAFATTLFIPLAARPLGSAENPISACPRPEFLHQRYIKSRESLLSSPIRLVDDEDEDADVDGLMG
jgi:hypothetical protein